MQSAGYGDGPGWRGGQPEELGGADPYYETLLEEERRAAGLEGVELEEDAAFLSVRDVHGYSVSPIMLPGSNGGVAYATGPFLVIWNWKADRKEIHRKHRHPITCMSVNVGGTSLVTSDADQILLWDTRTWAVTARAILPKGKSEPGRLEEGEDGGVGKKVKAFEVIKAGFLGGHLRQVVSLEMSTEISAVQCLRVWMADGPILRCMADMHITQDPIHCLRTLPDAGSIYLCSNGLISSWTCIDSKLGAPRSGGVVKGWALPCEGRENVYVGCEVASSVGWVLGVVSDGSVHIVSDAGERLRTVRRDSAVFTSSCMDGSDCLLVGTARGTVLWYNVPSMDVWRRIPYDIELRDSMRVRPPIEMASLPDGSSSGSGHQAEGGGFSSSVSGGDGVRADSLCAHGGMCVRSTADTTISILDLTSGAVSNALFGHIAGVKCLASSKSARTSGVCVYTGSLDETLGIWELDETKGVGCGQHRFLDMASLVHPSLSYRRGLACTRAPPAPFAELSKMPPAPGPYMGEIPVGPWPHFGERRGVISVESVAVDASSQLLACGTSHGCCLIYELRKGKLRSVTDICRTALAGMAFAPGGKYLVVRSAQGWVWVLDNLSGFKKSIVVQEPAGRRNSVPYWNCHDLFVIAGLSPVDSPAVVLDTFHIVTLFENSTIAVYRVSGDRTVGMMGAAGRGAGDGIGLPVLEPIGRVGLQEAPMAMALHASHHYVYTMSESGLVEVSHLQSAQAARGGLLAVPPETEDPDKTVVGRPAGDAKRGAENGNNAGGKGNKAGGGIRGVCIATDNSGLFLATVIAAVDAQTATLCIWEAATGEFVDCIRHLPMVTCMAFTQDNMGIVAGCEGGCVVHFGLSPELSRDARLVMLGGPVEMADDAGDDDEAPGVTPGGLYTRRKRGEAASGYERYERMSMVPDVVMRAISGTSARSVHALWADKPVQLPALPKKDLIKR